MTELETLAVIWVMSHFRSHLYGGRVTVLTDHTAVKAVLEPKPHGKACEMVDTSVWYRSADSPHHISAGKDNVRADTLS